MRSSAPSALTRLALSALTAYELHYFPDPPAGYPVAQHFKAALLQVKCPAPSTDRAAVFISVYSRAWQPCPPQHGYSTPSYISSRTVDRTVRLTPSS